MGLDFDEFKEKYQQVPVEEYPNRVVEAVPDPVVSIHVSTYQHADFIEKCLDGVLIQETDFPFEVIIGEDESTDGTREICKEYADHYPEKIRLFLHRRENNIAIRGRATGKFQLAYSHYVARGEYIAICEGDDFWRDNKKIQKQVAFLSKNEKYSISHHDGIVLNEGESKNKGSFLPKERRRSFSEKELAKVSNLLTPSLCYKNVFDSFESCFFSSLNGDMYIICKMAMYGEAKYQGDIAPSARRRHKGGIWSGIGNIEMSINMEDTFRCILKMYKSRNVKKEVKNEIVKNVSKSIMRRSFAFANKGFVLKSLYSFFRSIGFSASSNEIKFSIITSIKYLRFWAGVLKRKIKISG
jgi:glycosyltransferase involved in cell wall biosynthesis